MTAHKMLCDAEENLKRKGSSLEIALLAVKYPTPKIPRMVINGFMRMPLSDAPALARALGIDPKEFTTLVLKEGYPEVVELLGV